MILRDGWITVEEWEYYQKFRNGSVNKQDLGAWLGSYYDESFPEARVDEWLREIPNGSNYAERVAGAPSPAPAAGAYRESAAEVAVTVVSEAEVGTAMSFTFNREASGPWSSDGTKLYAPARIVLNGQIKRADTGAGISDLPLQIYRNGTVIRRSSEFRSGDGGYFNVTDANMPEAAYRYKAEFQGGRF